MSSQQDEPPALDHELDFTLAVEIPDSPEGLRSLQSWSTMPDVLDNIDQHVHLTMKAAVTTAAALGIAEAAHQDTHIIRSAERRYFVQAVRRVEVLTAGLGISDGDVLAAAALMYLCWDGLRTDLSARFANEEYAEAIYHKLGGDRTASIAETAYVFNGVLPDGRSLRRKEVDCGHEQEYEPEYKEWLDKLAANQEVLLVLLADNYAFGDIFSLMHRVNARNVYRETKHDLLPLAKGTPGVDDLFGPWLDLYAALDNH